MAIGKSIVNFFKAASKHNKHLDRQKQWGKDIKAYQDRVTRRKGKLDTANQKLAKSTNNLNLADANISAHNTKLRGVKNKLGKINNNIKTQTDIILDPKSTTTQIKDAQTQLTRLTQEQQNHLQDLNNLKKSIKTFKNDRKTAKKDVKKYTKAQTQANKLYDEASNNYNSYVNNIGSYTDPGWGVRTAARIMRDPASLYKEPLRYGAMYGIPIGAGYAYANGTANTEKALNQTNANQAPNPENTGVSPEDVLAASGLVDLAYVPQQPVYQGPELTPEHRAMRMATETTPPAYAMQNGIGPVPQDQWMASAPQAPLVVGNPTEAYSNFAPGPEHLPDVPQDEWDSYAPVQITNPMKEAIRIQLERERQAQATNN